MTQNPTSSGSSLSGGAGSQPPVQRVPLAFDGPETVINPERRSGGGELARFPSSSGSSLWTRLFPHDSQQGGELSAGPVGCRLGHFLIESMIGTGGMGAVFRALDERLDRIVALKVLSPNLSRDAGSVQRFVNEARAAARLDHDNIARVYFVGEEQGLHFIAHEFVTGRNIRDMIRDYGPFDPREAVNYALQIVSALRHTSAAGVVHRDIKPSNIIITPRGRAKLVDLGLAKKMASESFGDLTIAGTTLGTFDYISPEQAKDPRNVDVRSDIYSLGCTLYHMLAGEAPYPEGTVLQKLLDHQAKEVPDPVHRNSRTPPRLSAVVRRMMAPEPRDRYATPDELILDLLPIAAELGLRGINPEGLVWTSQPLGGARSFAERNLTWIVAAAALLLIAIFFDRFSEKTHGIRTAENKNHNPANGDVRPSVLPPAVAPVESEPTADGTPVPSPTAGRAQDERKGDQTFTKTESTQETKPEDSRTWGNILQKQILRDPIKVFDETTLSNSRAIDSNAPTLPVPLTGGKTVAAPPSVSVPDSAIEKPIKSVQPPAPPEISITDNEGGLAIYASLEAAVVAAKDGSSIELKFNGPRAASEKPIRVSGKRITIRGGRGYRPVISFSPRELPATGFETRMITLNNGGVELVDVDIQATVPETSADHWSLFSLGGPDRLRWRRVNITVTNPGNRQAEMIDISSSRDPMVDRLPGRPAGPMGAPQEFEVEIEHSFVRGNCGLFAIRTTEGGRLDIRQSLVALQGPLLTSWGDDESPGETRRLAIRMEHLTCFLGDGLLQMDSGEGTRYLLPLDVTARNNIFAANTSATALISVAGRTSDSEFPRMIRWDGTRNFYDHFSSYWSVRSSGAGTPNMNLSFENWKHQLGDTEIDSNDGGIVWKQQAWRNKPFATIPSSDFELANVNQAISGATDNTDVGADLSVIRTASEPANTAETLPPAGAREGSP